MLDLSGWIGGGLAIVAYVLVSTRRWAPDSVPFQTANMAGAGMLAAASFSRGALPSACINLVWIVFSLQVLVRTTRRSRAARPAAPATATTPDLQAPVPVP